MYSTSTQIGPIGSWDWDFETLKAVFPYDANMEVRIESCSTCSKDTQVLNILYVRLSHVWFLLLWWFVSPQYRLDRDKVDDRTL